MNSSSVQSDIAVVALNMNELSDDYESFQLLTAEEKISILKKRIKKICKELLVKEPSAMWIVVWREYGISEKNKKKGLPREIKKLFKKQMLALTKKYSQLTIIGGTISTKTNFKNEERLKRIRQFYDDHAWIEKEEQSSKIKQPFTKEKNHVNSAVVQTQTEWEAVRNTTYLFNGTNIWPYDKITPYYEKAKRDKSVIFQPGNKKNVNHSSTLTLIHPVTKVPIKIGIEICREHLFAVLKRNSIEKPLFHFVLSRSIGLKSSKMHGTYVLQLDSRYAPHLLSTDNDKNSHFAVHFYQHNIQDDFNLRGPLELDYLFINKIDETLQQAMHDFPDEKGKLEDIQKEFYQLVDDHDKLYDPIEIIYTSLERHINEIRSKKSMSSSFFKPQCLDKVANELEKTIKEHKIKNHRGMEYKTSLEATPLDKYEKFAHYLSHSELEQAVYFMDEDILKNRKLTLQQAETLLCYIMSDDTKISETEKDKHCSNIFENIKSIIMNPYEKFDNQPLIFGFCQLNRLDMVQKIIPYYKDYINEAYKGDTVLHFALKVNADFSIINCLIENGADPDITNSEEKSPFTIAMEEINIDPAILALLSELDEKVTFTEDTIIRKKMPGN